MATYFHGNSEIQAPSSADGLQTLVLMNPPPPPPAAAYIHYPDAPPPSHAPTNLLFLNSSAAGNNSFSPHAPPPGPHTQQFVGIPLSASSSSQDINHHHDVSALHGFLPRMQYNPWTAMDPTSAARDTPRAQQGLSLSLSSQQAGFGSFRVDRDVPAQAMSGEELCGGRSTSSASAVTNGGSSIQSVVLSSKYLKAAHELLEEVVSVEKNVVNAELASKKTVGESSGDGSIGGEGSGKRSSELSSAERQEISMKKAKLVSMVDEVEQRYRQYQQQMEMVVSSFEQAAGIGSARTYTSLALQTISKQFRCLKDAITRQIKAANKSLGEEDNGFGSRLKYVDHHLRQHRALQQLGMIQHNAWRPQRGLPERSVSVLRAWLFEHFLHPYPKDSDKHLLAKQTGLTRSQVSNWFINARVRLWKPMVEEMYAEEMKDHETSEDKSSKSNNQDPSTKIADKVPTSETESDKQDHNTPMVSSQAGFSFIMGSSELEGITQQQQGNSPKKPRINNNETMHSPQSNIPSMNMMDVKPNEQGRQGYSFMGNQTNFISGFGQYPSIGDIGRFDPEQFTTPPPRFSGNGVSLTLGLDSLPGTHHQSFLPNQNIQLGRSIDIPEPNDFVGAMNTSSSPHSSAAAAAFEGIGMQNPKRFAAQLLPDFVA